MLRNVVVNGLKDIEDGEMRVVVKRIIMLCKRLGTTERERGSRTSIEELSHMDVDFAQNVNSIGQHETVLASGPRDRKKQFSFVVHLHRKFFFFFEKKDNEKTTSYGII